MLWYFLISSAVNLISAILFSILIFAHRKQRVNILGVRLSCQCNSRAFWLRNDKIQYWLLMRRRKWDAPKFKPMKPHPIGGSGAAIYAGEVLGEPEWTIPLKKIYLSVLSEIKYREQGLMFPPWREHETWQIANELGLNIHSEYDMLTLQTGIKKIMNSSYIFYSNARYRKTGFPEMYDVHLTIQGERFLEELVAEKWAQSQ